MDERSRLAQMVRRTFRRAGRQYAASKRAYAAGRREASGDLASDERGRARIVCRRHAEQRAVHVDDEGRPACFDPAHQDCRGCAEDVRAGRVETWE